MKKNLNLSQQLQILDSLASTECICTPEQESGVDNSVCIRCRAAGLYNLAGEIVREGWVDEFDTANEH